MLTTVLAFTVIAALLGYIVYQSVSFAKERTGWATERRELTDRIQAPQRLPRREPSENKPRPKVLALNDDLAYKEANEERVNGS